MWLNTRSNGVHRVESDSSLRLIFDCTGIHSLKRLPPIAPYHGGFVLEGVAAQEAKDP